MGGEARAPARERSRARGARRRCHRLRRRHLRSDNEWAVAVRVYPIHVLSLIHISEPTRRS
eukprot:6855433-Prymnesium_polylepis.1